MVAACRSALVATMPERGNIWKRLNVVMSHVWQWQAQGSDPLPLREGRHVEILNEEITPLLPTGAGERYSQTPRAPEWMSPRRNWDSPNPPPASECALPPPDQRVGGHTRLRLKGWRSHNSDDWRKSLALCLLCEPNHIKFRTCSVLAPM